MKKTQVLVIILVIILTTFFWKFFNSDSASLKELLTNDSTLINPLAQKDDRGNVVAVVSSESFDSSEILKINPTYPSSTKELVPQYPMGASGSAALFMAQNLSPKYAVDKHLIKYKSTNEKDEPIIITAQVFIPKAGAKYLPVYVFGHGTTGIGNVCAASKEQPKNANRANYIAHMLAFSAQGYIVVFPDYEGFNDPDSIHHYFNSELESRVLLDGARSIYKFADQESPDTKPSDAVFLAGFSQGGHAALSAKDFAPKYAPNLPIKGIIAYAPATDVTALLREAPALSPYLFYAYADYYGKDVVDPSQLLQSKWLSTLEKDVTSICVDKVYKHYGYDPKKIYTNDFYNSLFNGDLKRDYPELKKILDLNTTGFEKSDIPVVIFQGDTDDIVTAKTVKGVTKKLCESENNVFYKEYPDINHYKIRQISYRDTLAWMESIVDEEKEKSSCSDFIN